MNNRELIALAGGLMIGAGIGILTTTKMLDAKYAARADEEIQEVKDHYKRQLLGDAEFESAQEETKEYLRKLDALNYLNSHTQEEIEAVFATAHTKGDPGPREVEKAPQTNPTEDLPLTDITDAEFYERDTEQPYVISVEEFQETGNQEKSELTYFKNDDILADERNGRLEDKDIVQTVGSDWRGKFGHESQDPNIVYVRNEYLETDYEIAIDLRSYKDVVGDVDDE